MESGREIPGLFYDGANSKPHRVRVVFDASGVRVEETAPGDPGGPPGAGNEGSAPLLAFTWTYASLPRKEIVERRGALILESPTTRGAHLELPEPGARRLLESAWPGARRLQSPFAWFMERPRRIVLGAGAGVVIAAALLLWGVPALGDLAAAAMPVEMERALGAPVAARLAPPLPEGRREIETKLQEFADGLGLPDGVTVHFVDDPETLNAFAVMGGHILLYPRILRLCGSPAALAGLLDHEYSHLAKRHSLRLLMRGLAGYVLVSWFFNDISGLSATIIGSAQDLRNLQFSRSMEAEADAGALVLLRGQGLPASGLAGLLAAIEVDKPSTATLSGFLSTHPDSPSRIARLEAAPAPDAATLAATAGERERLGILFGEIERLLGP